MPTTQKTETHLWITTLQENRGYIWHVDVKVELSGGIVQFPDIKQL